MDIVKKHFDTIDSTNLWGKHNAHTFPTNKITLITADTQTGGKGRFNRKWVSPSGQNIYASYCFFIEKHRQDIGNIPQILALATVKILENFGFSPILKWPNDILLSGKKAAGILTETTPLSDKICIIAGIGLNVNMQPHELEQIDQPAASMLAESGRSFNVSEILALITEQFQQDLELFMEEGFYPFLQGYRRHMMLDPSKIIRFSDNKVIWEGTIHAIQNDGSLSLRLKNGEIRTFLVGEVLL